jgi:hypothetical protein
MAQFFTSANLFQGRGAAESPGAGVALGDGLEADPSGLGADLFPSLGGILGGVNHKSIGIFSDESTGDSDKEQPAAFLDALVRMETGAARTVIQRPGLSPLVLSQCCFAGPNAAGAIYIAPSDVGTGAGQVNPDPLLRNISQLQQHPTTFVRSSMNVRGLVSQIDGGSTVETIANGTIVYQMLNAPTYSSWTLVIDGSAQQVIFPHPAGSDIRRPRDMWEEVIVPELQRQNSNGSPFPLWRDAGAGTLVNRGYTTRLGYCQYARYGGSDAKFEEVPTRPPNP